MARVQLRERESSQAGEYERSRKKETGGQKMGVRRNSLVFPSSFFFSLKVSFVGCTKMSSQRVRGHSFSQD